MRQFNYITIRYTLLLFLSSLIFPLLLFPVSIFVGFQSCTSFYTVSNIIQKRKFFMPAIIISLYASLLFIFFALFSYFSDPLEFEEVMVKTLDIVEESGAYSAEQLAIIQDYFNSSSFEILVTSCIVLTLLTLLLTIFGGFVSYLKCKLRLERTFNDK